MITTLSTDFADLVAEFISQELALEETGKLIDPGFVIIAIENHPLDTYRKLDTAFPSAKNYTLEDNYKIMSVTRQSVVANDEVIGCVKQFKQLIIPVHNWEDTTIVEYDVSPNAKLINYTVPPEYEVTAGYYRKSQCLVKEETPVTGAFIVDAGTAWSLKAPDSATAPAVFISCAITQSQA